VAQHNIIELNGKKYDAVTGELLGQSVIKATPSSRADLVQHRGRNMDGFIRQHNQGKQATVVTPAKQATHISQPGKLASKVKSFDIHRAPAQVTAAKPHQPQRPKTLMRHVVHKPDMQLKPAIKTTAPTEMMARPASTLAKPLEKKMSVTQMNPIRLSHARHVARSHHIRRFSRSSQDIAVPTQQAIAPSNTPISTQSAQRPAQYAQQHPVRQDFVAQSAARSHVPAQQPEQNKPVDVFEAALAHAMSHEQTTPKGTRRHTKKHQRLVSLAAGLAAFVIIGGFVTYMNIGNIEIRVASMHAGFHAELPSYKPTGYALKGGIQSVNGKVAMSYRSGDSSYTVTQEASDWNSSTLLDQTIAEHGHPDKTIERDGRTIYIYSGSNATWVNGGVLYQVNGDSLTTDELTSLATSM